MQKNMIKNSNSIDLEFIEIFLHKRRKKNTKNVMIKISMKAERTTNKKVLKVFGIKTARNPLIEE